MNFLLQHILSGGRGNAFRISLLWNKEKEEKKVKIVSRDVHNIFSTTTKVFFLKQVSMVSLEVVECQMSSQLGDLGKMFQAQLAASE